MQLRSSLQPTVHSFDRTFSGGVGAQRRIISSQPAIMREVSWTFVSSNLGGSYGCPPCRPMERIAVRCGTNSP